MRRILMMFLSLFLIISLIGCQKEDQGEEFEKFINNYIIDNIGSDYTSIHTYFENPEDYGIDMKNVEVKLGTRATDESFKEQKDKLNKTKKEFDKFDKDKLDKQQQIIYEIFKNELNDNITLSQDKYKYLGTVFESDYGVQVDIPMLFTDWELRNEQDVKDLILLVKDVLPYIDSLLDYTKEQAEKGYLMVDIDSVVDYCDNLIKSKENNSTLSAMKENIDALKLKNANKYKKQLEEAFVSSFIPAYSHISKELKKLKSYKNNTKGLKYLDGGKEYYEDLVQSKVGVDSSMSDIKKDIEERAYKTLKDMQEIYTKDSNAFQRATHLKTKYNSYEDMLKDLGKFIQKDFPDVGDIKYNIKNINPEIASNGIGAYFMVPAIDGKTPKKIRVNNTKNNDIKSIDTFKKIAHEGLPGHMYLHAYTYLNCPLYSKLSSVSGFQEGYATYVELVALDYLNLDKNAVELLKCNEIYTECMIILADIGIHYEGWSLSDLKDFFVSRGLSINDENCKKQYEQLQGNPVAFFPYYLGLIEILDLKDEAQEELGNRFESKDFHEALIKNGPTYFSVVEESIEEYIDNKN